VKRKMDWSEFWAAMWVISTVAFILGLLAWRAVSCLS